jgi:hypothetical protein
MDISGVPTAFLVFLWEGTGTICRQLNRVHASSYVLARKKSVAVHKEVPKEEAAVKLSEH